MKRSDMTACEDYGHARSNDWADPRVRAYGRERPVRVRVLDTKSGWDLHYRYGRGPDVPRVPYTDPSGVAHSLSGNYRRGGPKVLVEYLTNEGERQDPPRYGLVPSGQIRAPWAEAVATYNAAVRQVDQTKAARAARVADAKGRARAALETLGLEAGHHLVTDAGAVTLDLVTLEGLAERLERVGA